jgi:PKD repeat protein
MTVTVDGIPCSQTGTVRVCDLSCSASVPAYGAAASVVGFASTATLAGPCPGPITYAWTFGDGGTSTAQNPSHTYAAVGDYPWTLTVTANGLTCAQSGTIIVCTLTCAAVVPASGVVAFPVSFASTATLTGSCPGPIAFAWDFGDGATAATQNATHTYAAGGTFTWTLVVTANGLTCSQTGTIKICPYDVSTADEYGRSRLCFNTITGDWQWIVLRGPGIGTYTGAGTVNYINGTVYLRSLPGEPWTLSVKYMQVYKKASASFSHRPLRFNSVLVDNNTINNPICCP